MPSDRAAPAPRRRAPFSALIAGVFGLALLVGGLWLAALGGSWFYGVAGLLLLITAGLLWRGHAAALLAYAGLVVAMLLWSIYERGLDWWALAARGDLVFLLGLALLTPPVARALAAGRRERLALGAALALAAIVGVISMLAPARGLALEGHLPGARPSAADAAAGAPAGDWPAYGRTWRGDHYSPLAQITPSNVSGLRQAWVFHTGDLKQDGDPDEFTYEVTPLKVGGLVYVCSPRDIVFALDPDTGRQVWRWTRRSGRRRTCST